VAVADVDGANHCAHGHVDAPFRVESLSLLRGSSRFSIKSGRTRQQKLRSMPTLKMIGISSSKIGEKNG
jgi:hypothetical protein